MSKFDDVQREIRETPGLGKKMLTWSVVGGAAAILLPFTIPVGLIGGAAAAYLSRKKT